MSGTTRPIVDPEQTAPPLVEPAQVKLAAEIPLALPDIGDYEVLAELGRGGMGVVYKARHRRLDRVVALKTILAGPAPASVVVRRFQGEAESAARLDHPGIVQVYEFGEYAGQHYFTMDFVEGQSLAARLAHGSLEPEVAAIVVRQAAEAVDFAHRAGVVHRDLKPANILIDRFGTVRVADFGLARRLDSTEADAELPSDCAYADTFRTIARLTMTGAVMGTPAYMAPEQATNAKEAGPSADVWGLGAVLYACLTGRPPFSGASAVQTITLMLETEPTPPHELNPSIDHDLEAICLHCLRKNPAERYESAGALAADLARWQAGGRVRAVRIPWTEQAASLDADYPEAIPLLAGLLSAWLGNAQEGLFVGCVLAAGSHSAHAPAPRNAVRWAGFWAVLLGASAAFVVISGPTPLLPPLPDAEFPFRFAWLGLAAGLGAGCGALLGTLLAFGAHSLSEASWLRGLLYRGILVLGLLMACTTEVVTVKTLTALDTWDEPTTLAYQRVRWIAQWFGPFASWLLIGPIGVSVGILLGAAYRRVIGPGRLGAQRTRCAVRLLMAITAVTILAIIPGLIPAGAPIHLDVSGCFGPGPLLTFFERAAVRLGLPVLAVWQVIFLGKFAVLTLAMAVAGVTTARLLRGRKRT